MSMPKKYAIHAVRIFPSHLNLNPSLGGIGPFHPPLKINVNFWMMECHSPTPHTGILPFIHSNWTINKHKLMMASSLIYSH
jgi:hypothetical protein